MSETSTRLVIASCPLPEHEAVRLMMVATGMSRSEVLLGAPLARDPVETFGRLVRRRLADEPLQYIEGSVDFGPITVAVDDRVLIPRPETEQLLELAVACVSHPKVIVDLCTGSGNLAIALSARWPEARVFATEISIPAAELASENVRRNGVGVEVLTGDLFAPLPASLRDHVDLIVANPPYLSEDELADVPPDVRREPVGALVAGVEGDEILRRIAAEAQSWLRPGGVIICEMSEFHAERIEQAFSPLHGSIEQDFSRRDRFVVGSRSVE